MENKIKVIDNFLDPEELKNLQNVIFSHSFSWNMPPPYSTCHSGTSIYEDFIYFTHFFFDKHVPLCKSYSSLIVPILKKLNCAAPIDVKSNIFFNKLFETCDWHVDHSYNATTAILYLNNCNGGTEFKLDDEIKFTKSEENRMVIFSSKIKHRPRTSTDSSLRYMINFNYFE